MTMTGLEVFDSTIHTTNVWLKEIMEELHWEDRQKAYAALRAVLHVLRDRLIIEEAATSCPRTWSSCGPRLHKRWGLNAMMESVFRTISPRELKRLPARRGHDRKHLHQSRAVSGRKHEATETKTAYQEKMEAQLKKWSAKIGELTGGRRKGLG